MNDFFKKNTPETPTQKLQKEFSFSSEQIKKLSTPKTLESLENLKNELKNLHKPELSDLSEAKINHIWKTLKTIAVKQSKNLEQELL